MYNKYVTLISLRSNLGITVRKVNQHVVFYVKALTTPVMLIVNQ